MAPDRVPLRLDPAQREVVEHPGGPLLVLAGPGTGKTATLVETFSHRVERRGVEPERVLVLTFSRKAAQELRVRLSRRLARTTRGPLAMTFHSYAYALLRRDLAERGGPPLRLLSGPEQDVEVARLLAGELADGAPGWPPDLRPALPLRGLRQELRDVIQRAQERGLSGADLVRLGHKRGRPEWQAAGRFLSSYDGRFALDPSADVLDHGALVRAAADLLEQDDGLREKERTARALVLVDEFQDTDPAQVRLLAALAGQGRDLVVVGDPDQSIYAFRGSDPRGLLDFPDRFRTADGERAPVVALQTSRRAGAVLLAASRAVAARLPGTGLTPLMRALHAEPADGCPGQVEIRLAASPSQEAALVADVLRRAHLHDGLAWSQMAVLVRSTPRRLAVLQCALHGAGVPVAVPADEVPLAEQPLVRALLDLVRGALRPDGLDAAAVLALLTGPLVGADALTVRRLRRELREVELAAGGAAGADELLLQAVRGSRAAARSPLGRLQRLFAATRLPAGEDSAEQVLWSLWEASGLAGRLAHDSGDGGVRGALADRAIDGVLALFDMAARYVDRLPGSGAAGFVIDVLAQEVPADTLAQQAPHGDAVRIMTAHASKGLEWPLVVVAGVQEGVWPDLRLRGSLLAADELADAGPDAAVGPPPGDPARDAAARQQRRAALLAEERRLFYVAVTRASGRLVVTAVHGGEGEDRPSRFVEELGLPVPERATPVGRPLTGAGLVAELRQVAAAGGDPALVEAACRRLALMGGAARGPGLPEVPAVRTADPARWWGVLPLSDDGNLVRGEEQVRLSPSKVESFGTCSLRWFLESAVGIAGDCGPPQVLGTLVHALAELASGPDALDEQRLERRLDAVLPELDLGAPWAVHRRRQEALDQLGRFLRWQRQNERELVGREVDVRVPLSNRAILVGRVDRLERDPQGRAVVVDLKTGSTKPVQDELARHPQLGVYQLAAALGAFAESHGLTEPGGAALLQLRKGRQADEQRQVALGDDEDPEWAQRLVTQVLDGMSGADFPATVNEHCQRSCRVRSSCPAWPQGRGTV